MAGTDANVEIWLTDQTGKTAGPIKITEKGDAMERAQSNPITINLISELKGNLQLIFGPYNMGPDNLDFNLFPSLRVCDGKVLFFDA